jgi:hypothetical protein
MAENMRNNSERLLPVPERDAIVKFYDDLKWQAEQGVVKMFWGRNIEQGRPTVAQLYEAFKEIIKPNPDAKREHEIVAVHELLTELVAAYIAGDKYWGGKP